MSFARLSIYANMLEKFEEPDDSDAHIPASLAPQFHIDAKWPPLLQVVRDNYSDTKSSSKPS